jgi:pre-rRNA-processing protein TSR4
MEIVSDEEPPSPSDLSLSSLSLTSHVETDESVADEKYSKSIGDRTFQKFLRRIERAPEQVLRYLRVEGTTAEVLQCVADKGVEEKKRCRGCGGETGVEVQVMPGLLAQMDSDVGGKEELDWGVLNVLTCVGNCGGKEEGYVEEYLWKQDVSQEGLKSEADM